MIDASNNTAPAGVRKPSTVGEIDRLPQLPSADFPLSQQEQRISASGMEIASSHKLIDFAPICMNFQLRRRELRQRQ
jgi:hypothetical protein